LLLKERKVVGFRTSGRLKEKMNRGVREGRKKFGNFV
jgi:hypothetical protein